MGSTRIQRMLLTSKIKKAIESRLDPDHEGIPITKPVILWFIVSHFRFFCETAKYSAHNAISRGRNRLTEVDVVRAARKNMEKYKKRKVVSSKVKKGSNSRRRLNSVPEK